MTGFPFVPLYLSLSSVSAVPRSVGERKIKRKRNEKE
jgi:hypothetical protein